MELKGHEFELLMAGINDVRKAVDEIHTTVLSHDRDIRATKVIGKFALWFGGAVALCVGFYDHVLTILSVRKH